MLFILLQLFIVHTFANECAMVDDNLQYWTNTATAARQTSLLLTTGAFKLTNLEVTGQTNLQDTDVAKLEFDSLQQKNSGDAGTNSFETKVVFNDGIHVEQQATFSAGSDTGFTVEFQNLDIQFGSHSISDLIQRIKNLEASCGKQTSD